MSVSLKSFVADEAARLGVCECTVRRRIAAGKYSGVIALDRVNARVITVEVTGELPPLPRRLLVAIGKAAAPSGLLTLLGHNQFMQRLPFSTHSGCEREE
ncbi:MAG: hypothetical protein KGL39_02850 [Patescibacteria group bacterium]|nr:hypothetical protein [Patescibacteria group bacterium]